MPLHAAAPMERCAAASDSGGRTTSVSPSRRNFGLAGGDLASVGAARRRATGWRGIDKLSAAARRHSGAMAPTTWRPRDRESPRDDQAATQLRTLPGAAPALRQLDAGWPRTGSSAAMLAMVRAPNRADNPEERRFTNASGLLLDVSGARPSAPGTTTVPRAGRRGARPARIARAPARRPGRPRRAGD